MCEIFDEDIINNYIGWEIVENGKYLFNNGIEHQPTLIYNVDTETLSELSYEKNFYSGYQYVLFTSNHIIYNNKDNIIIEDHNNKILKIINNNDVLITYITKNDKYLFFSDNDNNVKIYNINTFEHLYNSFSYQTNTISISHDNKYYVNCGYKLHIYNLDTMEQISTININTYVSLTAICFKDIAIYGSNITIYTIDGTKLYNLTDLDNDEKVIYLDYSYDNNYLYCGTKSELIIYDTYNYNIVKTYDFDNVFSYCLTNDDYKILYVSDGSIDYIYTPQFNKFINDLLIKYIPIELVLNISSYLS